MLFVFQMRASNHFSAIENAKLFSIMLCPQSDFCWPFVNYYDKYFPESPLVDRDQPFLLFLRFIDKSFRRIRYPDEVSA